EAGIGALIPWADKLWFISYVAHIRGQGTGLYSIDETMHIQKHPQSVVGTFANRMVHTPSGQAIIGPHVIDTTGHVRTIPDLRGVRLTATMTHLTEPETKVYFLSMEGPFYETDIHTLETKQLFNLVDELELPHGAVAHFKGAYTANGRVVVANNTYHEPEHLGTREGGRLAEWDGKNWTILEKKPFVEVYGKNATGDAYGNPIYAIGWDRASVILKVFAHDKWNTYRLPKGSHSFDHAWNTEWFRIREAVTERFLMDAHGIFYELPALVYEGKVWGIKPISCHLRIVPDFCHWRGMFVMASDQTDRAVGQPQSGLWFGNMDELWQFGKPQGWGGPWWEETVAAGTVSDPFLMTGFDKKVVHLSHDADNTVNFTLEIDFLGNGTWKTFAEIPVPPHGYIHYEFPQGYSAHWVRLRIDRDCTASAFFVYT
ncbi:MAG: hypothetical protein ABIH23_09415, partial [bacterium]